MAGETACQEWTGTRNRQGYGVLAKPVHGSRLAHRAALAAHLGRPVDGVARHSCDNPPCVNPLHLLEGSQADNVADAVARGRARGPERQWCIRGHDTHAVGRHRANGQCCTCRREDNASRAAQRKAARAAGKRGTHGG